jgi:hypothetical protein
MRGKYGRSRIPAESDSARPPHVYEPKTNAARRAAASSCSAGTACEYTSSVNATVA